MVGDTGIEPVTPTMSMSALMIPENHTINNLSLKNNKLVGFLINFAKIKSWLFSII